MQELERWSHSLSNGTKFDCVNMKPKATFIVFNPQHIGKNLSILIFFKMAAVTIATEGQQGYIFFCNQEQNTCESSCVKTWPKNIFIQYINQCLWLFPLWSKEIFFQNSKSSQYVVNFWGEPLCRKETMRNIQQKV